MAEAEVEVAFTIERSREKGGGLNLKVFGIGAEGSGKGTSGRADVQRVTLKLHPHGELGAGTELGQSYLEIFLAGVLTQQPRLVEPAERIEGVVGMLRDATGEPWPFS